MFQLKEFDTPSEKQQTMLRIKDALEALPASIPFLRTIRVGINVNPAESYDLVLTADVDNMADLEAYSVHPAHVAVAKGMIAPVKVARACVDYEY
jgi:hypothetical protein